MILEAYTATKAIDFSYTQNEYHRRRNLTAENPVALSYLQQTICRDHCSENILHGWCFWASLQQEPLNETVRNIQRSMCPGPSLYRRAARQSVWDALYRTLTARLCSEASLDRWFLGGLPLYASARLSVRRSKPTTNAMRKNASAQ